MDIYQQLITNAQFAGTVPASIPLPSISGQSLYFENQSPYGFKVMDSGQSIEIDYIQPFGYLQMPYRAPLALAIDKTVQSAQTSPFQYLGVKFTDGIFGYAKGSLVSQGITDVAMNGAVTVGSISQTVNTSGPITNTFVPVSNMVSWGISQQALNLGPGVQSPFLTINSAVPILTDEILVFIGVPNGDAANFQLSVTTGDLSAIPYAYFSVNATVTLLAQNGYGLVYRIALNTSYVIDTIGFYIKNTSANATINETVTFHTWAKYASQLIVNSTTAPAIEQPSTGSFPAQYNINVSVGASGAATVLVPAAQGGYVQALQLSIQGTGTASETVQIQNGASLVDSGITVNNGTTVSKQYNFGSGVANNGITITETAFSAGSSMTVTGYAVIVQTAAPIVPATIH